MVSKATRQVLRFSEPRFVHHLDVPLPSKFLTTKVERNLDALSLPLRVVITSSCGNEWIDISFEVYPVAIWLGRYLDRS